MLITVNRRMLTACRAPGCPELVRGGLCVRHQGEYESKPWARSRPRRMPAGSGWAWQRVRATILLRDNYTCRYCGAPATVVDHVVGVLFGGTDDPSNLVASCEPCNSKKAQREARAGKMRGVA